MAIYRFNTNSGKVGSAIKHYNYINGKDKYGYKEKEIAYSYDFIPPNIDSYNFWKCADNNEPVNGRTYREFKLTLPHEFSLEENIQLVNEFIEKELGKDYYYSIVIHDKESSEKGINNIHAHLMFSQRKIDNIERTPEQFFRKYNRYNPHKGGAKKESSWNKKEKLMELRQSWEDVLNKHLETKNLEKVSCKSLKEQRKEALEKGDFAKAEFCNREAVHINGYLLHKDLNKMELEELEQLNNYLLNKEILLKAKESLIEARKKEFIKESFIEINSQLETIVIPSKENYSFNEYEALEENINILEREKFSIEFSLKNENIELETIKVMNEPYYNLLIEKENLIENFEANNFKDSDLFLEKLSNLNNKLESIPNPKTLPEFENIKLQITNELNNRLERITLNQTLFKNQLKEIRKNINDSDFAKNKLEKEFNNNFKRIINAKFDIHSLERKITTYSKNLERENLTKMALNIYSKGAYYNLNNRYSKIKNEITRLEPVVIYKAGANEEENIKNSKRLAQLIKEKENVEKEMEEFNSKYNNKNSLIKISFIKENLEEKYRKALAKSIMERKILRLELETLQNKIFATSLTKEQANSLISKYQNNSQYKEMLINKNNIIIDSLKNLINSKKLEELTLNKMSKGKYFNVIKEYNSLATNYDSLTSQINSLKFYEIEKRVSMNKERKELKEKLENLSNEYKIIKEFSSKPEFIEVYKSIKENIQNSLNMISKKNKVLQTDLYENRSKENIASSLAYELVSPSLSKITKEIDYSSISSENFPEKSGGGGSENLFTKDYDPDEWKRKKNMFEKGFSL